MKLGVYLVGSDKSWRTRVDRLEHAPRLRSNAFVALMLSCGEPTGMEWSGLSLFAPRDSFDRLVVFPDFRAAFQALSTIEEYPEHIVRRWFGIEEDTANPPYASEGLAQSL